jgi:hypothetical protein
LLAKGGAVDVFVDIIKVALTIALAVLAILCAIVGAWYLLFTVRRFTAKVWKRIFPKSLKVAELLCPWEEDELCD